MGDDQKPWAWYAGDGERFPHGPHETREDAIAEAFDNEEGFDEEDNVCRFEVMEAWQKSINFRALVPMDFDRMVEHWDEYLSDNYGDDDGGESMLDGITQAQWDDLKARIVQAAEDWQVHNSISIRSWKFQGTRNIENIVMAVPVEDGSATADAARNTDTGDK